MAVPAKIKILIIDDDEDDFYITSSYIQKITDGVFTIDWCASPGEALKRICEKAYDIYFIDYFLGAITGMDLLQQAIPYNPESPLILLTGMGNRDVALKALNAGAADYLVKSEITTESLERSIRYSLEKARSTRRLKENEQKFRTIFEKTRDALFMMDQQLRFQEVNGAMETLTGFSAEELIGISLYDILPDEKHVDTLVNLLTTTGEVNDLEIEVYGRSAEVQSCILSLVTVSSPDGHSYIQGVLHNISQLKKAERTALLSEKLAAAGRLARTLAHEIRNPLTNINLSLEQLLEISNDESQQPYFDVIARNSARINAIINDLLIMARPAHMARKILVLQDLIDKSIHAAMDRITLKKIQVQTSYPDRPAYIRADEENLVIAFLNIIINAIEAMEEYKGRLVLSVLEDNTYWEVRITDNGSGIPEDQIPKIFEPYYTSKKNGMGLGLTSTLTILQAHKAQPDVRSVEGVGTTFSILFPKVSDPSFSA
jgi:PAS domain S-box-containing protein